MKDAECVQLLQWALPQLGLRWSGYKRVRKQVCKRIARRCRELGLDGSAAYRRFLATHPEEWPHFETLCQVTISRFYRDRAVFTRLAHELLPELAARAQSRERSRMNACLRVWSVGCGAGEEPYSLSVLWQQQLQQQFAGVALAIVATDANAHQLERARRGVYPSATLRELPAGWSDKAFTSCGEGRRLRSELRQSVAFRLEDVRRTQPPGPFDLVLCRNLAFTYFDEEGQECFLNRLAERVTPGGVLVIGGHERLPDGAGPVWEQRGDSVYQMRGG